MSSVVVEHVRDASAQTDFLSVEHLQTRVERRAAAGGLVGAVAQGSQMVLLIAYNAVLARLLSPLDFGLVAIATGVSGLLNVFKDAGLSTATIQRENITYAQVSNLFWINVGVSGLATSAMALGAPLIAWFFRQPELVGLSVALSSAFLFEGLTVQHVALLNRQMQFRTISVIEVGSTAAGYLVGVGMALLDFGYWSLVGATVSTGALRTIAIMAVARWRPQRPTKRSGTRPLVRFGADLTLVGVLYWFARGSDTLLLGRFVGSEAVGLYSRATALLTRPMERLTSTITSVIVPALSRLQSEPDRYRQAFLLVFEGLAIIGFVFTGLFLPLAHPVVAVMFGQQWEAAAPIFAALTVAAIYLPLSNATSWLYTSQGRGRDLLLTVSVGACVMVASFSVGLAFGPIGVAAGYSVSGILIQLPITCYIAGRRGPVSAKDLFVALARHVPLGVVVLAVTTFTALSTAQLSPLTRLFLGVPSGLLAGAASLVLLPHTKHAATRILRGLNNLRTPESPLVRRSAT